MDATLERTIRERIEVEKSRTAPSPDSVPVPPIPTERYTDASFYALEMQHIFQICAGNIAPCTRGTPTATNSGIFTIGV